MDTAEILADILKDVERIFYARYEVGDVSQITFACANEEENRIVRFLDASECTRAWEALVHMLTKSCIPPFINFGTTLFHPAHARRVSYVTNELGHFAAVVFSPKRNLAFGYATKEEQVAGYQTLLLLLGEKIGEKPPSSLLN